MRESSPYLKYSMVHRGRCNLEKLSLAQGNCAKHTAANRDPRIPLSQTPYSRTAATTLKNEGVRDRV